MLIRDSAFSSNKSPGKKNLLKVEFEALKVLLKNKNIVVQKADKANTIVYFEQKR